MISKRPLPLDEDFTPAVIWNHNYQNKVLKSNNYVPIKIAIVRDSNSILVQETQIFSHDSNSTSSNYFYIEQLIKKLLWIHGGYKIIIGGSKQIGEYIKELYSNNGKRSFDAKFMSNIYEKPFSVEYIDLNKISLPKNKPIPLGRNLEGCRIGFDLGASDRKVSAVIDGKVVFSEEVTWNPGTQTCVSYHYHEIMSMLHRAAAHMPRVDAIGGSSAGVYIDNHVRCASIFRAIPDEIFESEIKNIFLDIQNKWGVPLKVINDGEVTALAGSMSLKKNAVLGISMGSSEAGGYINKKGNINPWLNELAFVPIDFNINAPVDEWSGDKGCGAQYFSQMAAIRLAKKVGIILDNKSSPAERLKSIQDIMNKNNNIINKIFETIGGYLAYAIASYADLYDIENVLIMGRVTSGKGGQIIFEKAKKVLNDEFPELHSKIKLYLPDEANRRIGQAIAAASLPLITSKN